MRVYIAGPMRGYPEHNIPAFLAAAELLRSQGHDVVSPIELGDALGGQDGGCTAEDFVAHDLLHLIYPGKRCEAIALLPGWQRSVGARCEATVAVTLGYAFLDATTGDPIAPPTLIEVRGGYALPPDLPRSAESLDVLAEEVRRWQHATFPRATPASAARHLLKEARELDAAPTDAEEIADVLLLIIGVADAAGVDLAAAARAKLEINKTRSWGVPDADGVVEHIDEIRELAPDVANQEVA